MTSIMTTRGLLACLAILPVMAGTTWAAGMECKDLSAEKLGVPDITLTHSEAVAKGAESPLDHCLIQAMMDKRKGIDGRDYAIRFEMRLPADWNGSFVHQFNGGNDGEVVPAFGPLLSGNKADTALSRGFAVVSSDSGHDGAAVTDAGLAGGARFGFDPEARRDYGYSAIEKLNPVAVQIVEAFYGDKIKHSYGVGGSNGGRHALVEATRAPDMFDGLLVGYPGFNLPKAAIQHALDVQSFKKINGDIRKAFAPEDLTAVTDTLLSSCDELDGLEDGWIGDVDACQSAFKLDDAVCKDGQNSGCISTAQAEALTAIMAGPRNSKGEQLYSEWVWDRGMSSGNWRFWKLESPIPPWENMPLIAVMGSASLAQIFSTPPVEVDGSPAALEKFLLDYDFDKDAPKIFAKDATFTESAMDFMTPTDVANPKLEGFNKAGGKMIVFHGVSDPVFSIVDTTRWYEALDANNDGKAEDFVRYYRVPGMTHGAGGPAFDTFDFFGALVDWVETGSKPGAITAGLSEGNRDLPKDWDMAATRKLCPYPAVARYTGSDPNSADSFTCQQ